MRWLTYLLGRVGRHLRSTPRWISEEEDLAYQLERLDKEQPGWDTEARTATAAYFLTTRMSREQVVGIYGEDIVREAERRAEAKQ